MKKQSSLGRSSSLFHRIRLLGAATATDGVDDRAGIDRVRGIHGGALPALLALIAAGCSSSSTPLCGAECGVDGLDGPTSESSSDMQESMPNQPQAEADVVEAPNTGEGQVQVMRQDELPSETEASSPEDAVEAQLPVRGQGPAIVGDTPTLLRLSTRFYGAQRSGDGANWLLQPGQACHTFDGESIQQDLSGGWYDAGDHVKVTISISYASYLMLKAFDAYADAFQDTYGARYEAEPNGVPDVLDEARYATDYLVKAHIAENELVGMVGNATADHSTWLTCLEQEDEEPENGGRPRPVSTDANADIAGITAGSLAIMSRLYRAYDAELADSYLTHARQIFQIGVDNPSGSNPGLYAQRGTGWIDEMLVGAAELYRATNEEQYLEYALDFNAQLENHGWAPNYSQASDFARHTLYVAGQAEAVEEFWRLDVENYAAQRGADEFTQDLVFFDNWGSLRYASGAAFSAALLYEATGNQAARDLASQQLSYIMGDNSYGRSFVVGFGTNPPQQPHHRNAQGTGDINQLPFVHTLEGALVGGPSRTGVGVTSPGYEDDVNDYVSNEVALDYNAGLVGLAAFGVLEQAAQQ